MTAEELKARLAKHRENKKTYKGTKPPDQGS